jgi:hypothetical protein
LAVENKTKENKMNQPYKHRINNREFLNLPGFHESAYVVSYVEDTSERCLKPAEESDHNPKVPYNFEPRMILEIADCCNDINLEFELYNAHRRKNSFHKIDTLISALQDFRQAMAEESTLYKQRQHEIDALAEQEKAEKEQD